MKNSKNPLIKVIGIFLIAGLLLALYQLFGGDIFRIFQVAWEWILSLLTTIKDFFLQNEFFQKIAKGPNG